MSSWNRVAVVLLSLAIPQLADAKPTAMPSRLFHTTIAQGGLIEGACTGVGKDDVALVLMPDGRTFSVPLELFDPAERTAICEHFEVEPPADRPRYDPTPADQQSPWHTFRGGIMAQGKIVAEEGRYALVVDRDGRSFRAPLEMMAEGARPRAEAALDEIDPSRRKKLPEPKPGKKDAAKPEKKSTAKGKGKKKTEDSTPPKPDLPPAVAQALEKMEKIKPKPATPSPTPPAPDSVAEADGGPKRHARVWKNAEGEVVAEGKFVAKKREGDDDVVLVWVSKDETREMPLKSLSPRCKAYVKLAVQLGEVDFNEPPEDPNRPIVADADPSGPSRVWKSTNGVALSQGRFVKIEGDVVHVLRDDDRVDRYPLILLSEADRQFAKGMASGKTPAAAPKGAVVIASEAPALFPGQAGKSVVVVDGSRLIVLSADGRKVESETALPEGTIQVLERADRWVAAVGNSLVTMDKKSLAPKATHELWQYKKINHIAIHPTRRIVYASITNNVDAVRKDDRERQRFVQVDEETGDIDELGDLFATWSAVDPAGKTLWTGFKDVHQGIGDIRINGDGNILETPKWDNTDILRRFRIEDSGIELDQTFDNAGANGQGLVLAPTGKQIAYLSFTGFPTYSGNIALMNAIDFKKKPVTLPTKDKANTKRLAFHPTAALAVSPGLESGVVVFDTQKGSEIADAVAADPKLDGAFVHELTFSPDGKHLVAIASVAGGDRFVATYALTTGAARKSKAPSN